jgi:hypothetical protein
MTRPAASVALLQDLLQSAMDQAKNWSAVPRVIADSLGTMINYLRDFYLYDLPMVESNHERYADKGEIVASQSVQRILRNGPGKS